MNTDRAAALLARARRRGAPLARAPLARLGEDHRRIQGHCRALQSLMTFIAGGRFDFDAQMLGHLLLRFFDVQVPLHRVDEEEVLFPMLLESMAGSDAACIRELTQRCRRLHRNVGATWEVLRPSLLAIAAGRRAVLEPEHVARFGAEWDSQIRLEDTELLPLAERLLTPAETDQIRRRIRDRRW